MQCPGCQYANDAAAKFCIDCGTPLTPTCTCATANAPHAKFCAQCGLPLTSTISADGLPACQLNLSFAFAAPQAERRQVTVMFCDLVDSTPLSEQLDPEELCAEVISQFEGYIARYFGDGLLVYFGYPKAHGDDAARAVRSGLGILAAIRELNPHLREERSIQLELRIGIHTGLVVAGDIAQGGQFESIAIVGETPNLAACLQGLAAPNALVVSEATRALIGDVFQCRALGPHNLRGISQAVEIHQILRHRVAQPSATAAPLVGRQAELQQMLNCWAQVGRRKGRVLLYDVAQHLSHAVRFGMDFGVVEHVLAGPHAVAFGLCGPGAGLVPGSGVASACLVPSIQSSPGV
tara:strand:- start:594 stop:1643 length:1050 start_codon:yes stop_codon:yes gene_type:complete